MNTKLNCFNNFGYSGVAEPHKWILHIKITQIRFVIIEAKPYNSSVADFLIFGTIFRMSVADKDSYFVAVKVFLEKDSKLLILKDNFGDWDLPGGRIKKNEFTTKLSDVLERKMRQEIGSEAMYTMGAPTVFMRHERVEAAPGNPVVRIFAVGYKATLTSGNILLSPRHTEMQWVDINTFKPEKYFTGGWLKGVKEYQLQSLAKCCFLPTAPMEGRSP